MDNTQTTGLLQKRFILCLLVIAGAFLLRFSNLLTDNSFTQIVIWITGIFVAGDIGGSWMLALVASKTATLTPTGAVPTSETKGS